MINYHHHFIDLFLVASYAICGDGTPGFGIAVPLDVGPTTSGSTTSDPNTLEPENTTDPLDPTTPYSTTLPQTTTVPATSDTSTQVPTTPGSRTLVTSTSATSTIGPTTSKTTTPAPTTLGSFTPGTTTSTGTSTSAPTTTRSTTFIPTSLTPTTASPHDYLYVSLVVFSGLINPHWQIIPNQEIRWLLSQARGSNLVYPYLCIPPKTGYKGLLVREPSAVEEELIVGPQTVPLQLKLYDTMPSSSLPTDFRQRIRKVIDSGYVTAECGPDSLARRKRYAPPYNPHRWNRLKHTVRCNNCYNYANTLITNTFVQPGRGGGQQFALITANAVRDAAVRDGLAVLNIQPGAPVPGPPAGDRHLVALFVAPGVDYHWFRLDDNGRWSHKMGDTRVTDLDDSKPVQNRITDPRDAFIDKNRGVIYAFVCFMTTNRKTVTVAGVKPRDC